jgi:hypothetical protein
LRKRALAAWAAAGMLALSAGAAEGVGRFQSPTGNLICIMDSGRDSPAGSAIVACQSRNDGFLIAINAAGKREAGYTEPAERQRMPVLRYGRSRAGYGFRCTSRVSGMTCRSVFSGRGFFISRDTWGWIG